MVNEDTRIEDHENLNFPIQSPENEFSKESLIAQKTTYPERVPLERIVARGIILSPRKGDVSNFCLGHS